jgi:hypothetical protein
MSNSDRLQREAEEHAETLVEDRGASGALAWAIKCANRTTDGFWMRVVQAIRAILEQDRDNENDDDPSADYGDWKFHQDHDQ